MLVNKNISIILFLLIGINAKAQWDVPITQFWTLKSSYNPSFVGEKEEINVQTLYKMQWMNADDSPRTILINANTPIKLLGLNHGVGIIISNTNVGKERNSFIAAQYAYKQKIGIGWLNAGIQVGLHELNFDANSYQLKVDSTQNNKKSILANPIDKKRFDVNAGISWTSQRFFAGVGVRHINEPKYYSMNINKDDSDIDNDSIYSKIPISYNLMLGCNIKLLDTLIEIQPMVFAQSVDSYNSLYAAMQLSWNNKFSAGAMWRGDEGYSFFAGAILGGVEVRYAYDMNKIGQRVDAGANHEIAIQYNFALDMFKPKPQPHKSIRLL